MNTKITYSCKRDQEIIKHTQQNFKSACTSKYLHLRPHPRTLGLNLWPLRSILSSPLDLMWDSAHKRLVYQESKSAIWLIYYSCAALVVFVFAFFSSTYARQKQNFLSNLHIWRTHVRTQCRSSCENTRGDTHWFLAAEQSKVYICTRRINIEIVSHERL